MTFQATSGNFEVNGIQDLNLNEIDLVGGGELSTDLETVSLAAGAAALGATFAPIPGARFVAAGLAAVSLVSYAAAQIID
ncbi:MAG: hypothetical protein GW858_10800 [Sphingomonadales bacterium]|nr:hypothetical protein [Sphingomonadales bacterium]NCQ22197.1 hypothetical protein [Sphingomonadales bacterium]NCT03555.1 hypothetical protein [Sphingomonadales bacterium]